MKEKFLELEDKIIQTLGSRFDGNVKLIKRIRLRY